jgi:hypothetical protein
MEGWASSEPGIMNQGEPTAYSSLLPFYVADGGSLRTFRRVPASRVGKKRNVLLSSSS